MPLLCLMANSALTACFSRAHARFRRVQSGGSCAVRAAQESLLFALLRQNSGTAFGQRWGFATIDSPKAFQAEVPISRYEDYEADIARICDGGQNILTTDRVSLLEPTSGSSGAQKLIPYTAALKRQFQCGIQPWLYDLYTRTPGLRSGKSYWSVTPAATAGACTSGGLPIGFEKDEAYLGRLEQVLLNTVFAVDSGVARLGDIDCFYHETALALLRCQSLTLISVWNPTFFLLVLDTIHTHRARLLEALPPARAAQIRAALEREDYAAVWPRLRVVSCWCDAAAAPYAAQLAKRLPQAVFQPKGLLSTEGFTSFPLVGEEGARLSVLSHFFEFLPTDGGTPLFAWQLEPGAEYEVLITTAGGLYRYRTNDKIRVLGDCDNIPRLTFLGRGAHVCDLFGEKLNEHFVEQTVRRLVPDASFFLLAPDTDRYILYLQAPGPAPDIDSALRESFHYDYCRKLGQLKPAVVYALDGDANAEYLAACVQMGQRLGDVKPLHLSTKSGWEKYFGGDFV